MVMCLCGHKIIADTTEEAWLLLDAHCLEEHGDPFQGRGTTPPKLATGGFKQP